jgi:hypothetical protein
MSREVEGGGRGKDLVLETPLLDSNPAQLFGDANWTSDPVLVSYFKKRVDLVLSPLVNNRVAFRQRSLARSSSHLRGFRWMP